MRKLAVGFLLFWCTGVLIVEAVNKFEKPKELYSMFYSDKLIKRDTLFQLQYLHEGGGFKNKTTVYEGILTTQKHKAALRIYPDPGVDSIAVWYFSLTGNVIPRRTSDFPSPIWYGSHWLGSIMLISWLPLLLYYIKLKRK